MPAFTHVHVQSSAPLEELQVWATFCVDLAVFAGAPVVVSTWALGFGGCAAAEGGGCGGSQAQKCTEQPENLLPKQLCAPVCIALGPLLPSPNGEPCWLLLWSFTFGRYQGRIPSVVEALMEIYLPPCPIILLKLRKQKNVKSAKKIIGKWCSWTSSC